MRAKLVPLCWQPELKVRAQPEAPQARRLRAAQLMWAEQPVWAA